MVDNINLLETTKAALAALADRAGGEIIINPDDLMCIHCRFLVIESLPSGAIKITLKPLGKAH